MEKKDLALSERQVEAKKAKQQYGLSVAKSCQLFGLTPTAYDEEPSVAQLERDEPDLF